MRVDARTTDFMTLLELLRADLENALMWNQNAKVAPVCLLWPDGERGFASGFEILRQNDARFYELGAWDEAARRGPAVWLRWKLDSGEMSGPAGEIPIWYLGGVSRAELRPDDEARAEIKPLCELLYRGEAWTHVNGKDQTPLAWLLGHGVDIALDAPTREALGRTLPKMWDLPLDSLRGRGLLRAADFDDLLHPEPIENLLLWMNDAAAFRASIDEAAWRAFGSICLSRFSFSPHKDGVLGAAERLATGAAGWDAVWKSFERTPLRFEGVIKLLEKLRPATSSPPAQTTLDFSDSRVRYPALCAQSEVILRSSLAALDGQSAGEARSQIDELEILSGFWRASVWAKIGRAPLAQGLEKLRELGARTLQLPLGASPQDMAKGWASDGYRTDALVLEALALGGDENDFAALKSATRALYGEWLDSAAQAFASKVIAMGFGLGAPKTPSAPGTVHLFADGLRFDLAQRLCEKLERRGLQTRLDWNFGPLPGVTPTAKPAVTPLGDDRFRGGDKLNTEFVDGRKVGAEILRTELAKEGYLILNGLEIGEPTTSDGARGWTETGQFDSMGHHSGAGLARLLETELETLSTRIASLLAGGWSAVEVVTDHGWLLLPGGLVKAHLPEHLTEVRKGRCARLKTGHDCEFETVKWHWDTSVEIAMARGARCFEEGREYEHGGLSLQECVLPKLLVWKPGSGGKAGAENGEIHEAKWSNRRLRVKSSGGHRLDLRSHLNDGDSSICGGAKMVGEGGNTSLVVEDDEAAGLAAHLVLLGKGDEILDKQTVTVGG